MKKSFAILAAFCALFVLLAASQETLESCRYGLRLCVELIVPSLFPFFVVSLLLAKLGFPAWLGRRVGPLAGKLLGLSPVGTSALVIGLCGGYPMGAAYLADLVRSGALSERECGRLLAFCNNSGPAFLVGAIGSGVFGSSGLGLILYAVHAASALLTALLLRGGGARETDAAPPAVPLEPPPFSRALTEAVRQAVEALLGVCGFVVVFSVFTGLLKANGFFAAAAQLLSSRLPLSAQAVEALLTGFWELGSGIGALRGLPPTPLHLALASAIVGWGGVSVHFQTLSLLADREIPGGFHTMGRVMSAGFGFVLSFAATLLFL